MASQDNLSFDLEGAKPANTKSSALKPETAMAANTALGPGMVLVPPRDPGALAAALEGLLGDPAALDELAVRARRTAEEHFSWERCGRETVAAYEDVRR